MVCDVLTQIQFVAIARLAPFVLISRALISVGYSQGTLRTPEPNACPEHQRVAPPNTCCLTYCEEHKEERHGH